ncbi:heterokaryon incompatibility [Fusarium albosuccineum]|uniref:Heterokaryon incompatibility n=1 Tax=Fusarium albosuccineum TaxID=1237068 RepID=A0A8H4PFE7_9HYPO|nr:heterokaryon incompatibility [Fusarium albosuccineum]
MSEPYVSLSHCWGNAQILKLTTGNIASLKGDIPFARLPQTFQDAIQTVRNLGINYIWIDSLCIIQNSDEDWQKEARTMLQVYKHALFNIAATRSSNSFGGLFTNRNPKVLGSGVLDIDNGVLKGRFDLIDEDYFGQEIDNAPLNRRSWVAQERILSPRIIHFASEQVIWDCSELTACESLPQGTKVWSQWGGTRRKFSCKQSSHFVTRPRTLDEGLGQWARIVNTYSDCGLTVLGDKLIAIFGVAEHLRNELKVEYHAGLWREKMEIQLAWYVTELQVDRSPRNDLAPSWSWTSINGAVDLQQVDLYEGYDITTLASITEVDLRREADQLRGEKVVGHLRMRCSLNPVTIEGGAQNYRLGGKRMEHARSVVVDSPDVIGAERLYFVPLFDLQTPLTLEEWNVMSQIRGLIVQGVEGKPGTFTRCGHAFIADQVHEYTRRFSDTYEAIKSPVGKAELPCDEYNPDLGHLITLI